MKLPEERQLLPIVRDAVTYHEQALPRFMEAISPLYDRFIAAGIERDTYSGWAFDLEFINSASSDCEPYRSTISSAEQTWKFFPEAKDACIYAVPGKGIIKIHLHSFLWSY